MFQFRRKRQRVFAPWAAMRTPYTAPKHTLKENKVCFTVRPGASYANHVEMSGFFCSSIISYGADENGCLRLMRHVVFPQLRLYPNLTHSSLDCNFHGAALLINGEKQTETAEQFVFDGILHIFSHCGALRVERKLFAARMQSACMELLTVENTGDAPVCVSLQNNDRPKLTAAIYGVDRKRYRYGAVLTPEKLTLQKGEEGQFCIAYGAVPENAELPSADGAQALCDRTAFLKETADFFIVESPNETINAMARFAKIRACESIYKTKAGLMHSPGGGGYYAALWTNDQCEYINPLFAYLGYPTGVEQAKNCYKLYQKYISPKKALITSIISEGDGIWHGAKDRGDSAMYAYGCARFLLSLGDKETAKAYLQPVRDCLAYTLSKRNADGVIESDSDELENRFESGKANLCTSSLAYDALLSAAYLEEEFGNADAAQKYRSEAEELRKAIERYFGREVDGFATYRYCAEESRLRSWIAIPLTMGITDRAEATTKALLSPALRQNEGLVTRRGEKTFWDRSTLYALRGMFYAGQQESALELLETYSKARLLGEHIPYAVEAFPEGNQAQLSAESGLYLRIFSEGVLGYRPTGFDSFELRPHLPAAWPQFTIRKIWLCGKCADVFVRRSSAHTYDIEIMCDGKTYKASGPEAVFTLQ